MTERALQRIDEDLWCLESRFVVWGCSGSVRMTLIATRDGLIAYSPVALEPHHIEAIAPIGTVSMIIAPNLYHHMFLRNMIAAYPRARVLVPEGLTEKIGALPGAQVMREGDSMGLPPEIETLVFSGHDIRETVLFHRPTRTLVTADLIYNYQAEHFAAERTFFRAIGCYGAPKLAFYHRFAVRDKASVRRLIETVQAWQPRRIVMCHGRIAESENAAQMFAEAWGRFS